MKAFTESSFKYSSRTPARYYNNLVIAKADCWELLQVNSKSVSDMLREVATVSPLFFKEVRPQSPLLKLFLEFYLNSFGKKLPFHKGLSVLRRFQTKLSLLSFPHDIVCHPLFSKRLSQNQVYLTLIHLSPKMFFSKSPPPHAML